MDRNENTPRLNIEDILLFDETLFRDSTAFDPAYIPEDYKYRDAQMGALAMCIRPALKKGKPSNAVILGPCASGKTTAIKKIFELVEKNSNKVVCCHVNCQTNNTPFSIISQIHQKVIGFKPPQTGSPLTKAYDSVMNKLSENEKALVVALDDVQYLFQRNHANTVFYDILKAHETYPNVKTSVFAIVSEIEFRYLLDKSVNSVFIPQEIVFQPYTHNEISNILNDRVRIGFYPNVISEEVVDEIIDTTSEIGDLRVGINLLRLCGNIAESEASKKITITHLEQAMNESEDIGLNSILKGLTNKERLVLKYISMIDETYTAGELFEYITEKEKISYATYDRALNKLEFLRLIDLNFTGKGKVGNSRLITLRFSPEQINNCLI